MEDVLSVDPIDSVRLQDLFAPSFVGTFSDNILR
jgi:hypothetical protein